MDGAYVREAVEAVTGGVYDAHFERVSHLQGAASHEVDQLEFGRRGLVEERSFDAGDVERHPVAVVWSVPLLGHQCFGDDGRELWTVRRVFQSGG